MSEVALLPSSGFQPHPDLLPSLLREGVQATGIERYDTAFTHFNLN